MKRVKVFLLSAGIVLLFFSICQALPVLDQAQLSGADQNQAIHSTRTVGQTFTVGTTGQFMGLELSLYELGAGPGLNIEILDMAGGDLSLAPILASAFLDESDLGPSPLNLDENSISATFIDFSAAALFVESGDLLAFRLSTDRVNDPTVGQPLFAIRVAWYDPYSGGGYFLGTDFVSIYGEGVDAAFKTYVNPVPEPATMLLLGAGLLGLAGVRRKLRIK